VFGEISVHHTDHILKLLMIVWTRTCSMNSPLFPCKLSEEKKCCLPFTSSEHGKDEEQHSSQLMFLNENAIAI
jgi:hypothetical protein